jgi:hypothetical protein
MGILSAIFSTVAFIWDVHDRIDKQNTESTRRAKSVPYERRVSLYRGRVYTRPLGSLYDAHLAREPDDPEDTVPVDDEAFAPVSDPSSIYLTMDDLIDGYGIDITREWPDTWYPNAASDAQRSIKWQTFSYETQYYHWQNWIGGPNV